MNTPRRSLSAMLIATSALIAPAALAQEAAQPGAGNQEAASPPGTPSTPGEPARETIIVQGEYIPEPLQETSEVASFITAVDLERQGDSDAAEALTRVTGLSIAEGRFIYVRGLGERYSSATLNGLTLPSPEPLQRVVPLDLFPSGLLGGVAVQKTYSVEYPGEFGGGVIDLSTVALPEESYLNFGLSAGANTASTLATGYTYEGDELDVIGFDDGTRKIPAALQQALSAGQLVNSSTLNLDPALTAPQEVARIGQSLENAKLRLVQKNTSIPGNLDADLSGGHIIDLGGGYTRIGLTAVAGFSNDWEVQDGVQQQLSGSNFRDFNYTTTNNDVGWDGLAQAGVQFGDHEIKLTNLYVRRTTKQTKVAFGTDPLNTDASLRDERTAWFERELFSSQLAGTFDFGALDIGVAAGYGATSRESPYEWNYRTNFNLNGDNRYRYAGNESVANARLKFSDLQDEVSSARLDVSYAIPRSGVRDMVFSAGLSHSDNSRKSTEDNFRFVDAIPAGSVLEQARVDFLFSDFNQSVGTHPTQPSLALIELQQSADINADYRAKLEVTGAYLKADLEPIPYLRTTLGVRGERAIETLYTREAFLGGACLASRGCFELKEGYYLPAAIVTWNFLPDMQLKGGASQTIGRPQFRELAPAQYLDPDSDRTFSGNPFLRDTRINNFDLRYEYYFGRQQFFTVGGFFKELSRPIESFVFQFSDGQLGQSYLNAPAAEILGGEIEIKKLWDSPFGGFLADKTFLTQANYTYADSQLKIGASDTVNTLGSATATAATPVPATNFFRDGAQLQGQSEHVANLQLGWEDDVAQGTFLVTYVSERVSARGNAGEPDYIQEPGVIVDFNYRHRIDLGARPVTFTFRAENLLDENYDEYQQVSGGEVVINRYDLGTTFTVGLSTEF
jgi:TonB-dependent receptor